MAKIGSNGDDKGALPGALGTGFDDQIAPGQVFCDDLLPDGWRERRRRREGTFKAGGLLVEDHLDRDADGRSEDMGSFHWSVSQFGVFEALTVPRVVLAFVCPPRSLVLSPHP